MLTAPSHKGGGQMITAAAAMFHVNVLDVVAEFDRATQLFAAVSTDGVEEVAEVLAHLHGQLKRLFLLHWADRSYRVLFAVDQLAEKFGAALLTAPRPLWLPALKVILAGSGFARQDAEYDAYVVRFVPSILAVLRQEPSLLPPLLAKWAVLCTGHMPALLAALRREGALALVRAACPAASADLDPHQVATYGTVIGHLLHTRVEAIASAATVTTLVRALWRVRHPHLFEEAVLGVFTAVQGLLSAFRHDAATESLWRLYGTDATVELLIFADKMWQHFVTAEHVPSLSYVDYGPSILHKIQDIVNLLRVQ